ncbi:UDP-N-acetylmuramoyl-L-alanine--D-glutamate ligase [Calditerricola satsumensis]|uniref:UDP-N-acetylmuramoylalanine--D-glutamate ligase n=2 Tax=Calditerricola satsumensis TaxID=373054 RepID=A0A8J3B391_9BACI|nr:UDP-N-acetylmuramoyl-L-alanine--D-glutamate ligase [Calditerricola satsumensis]GGJ92339.1 UDP-N-acetylmuramoylalanine--D-glutamate ligase [Calditerricola satsumensis]
MKRVDCLVGARVLVLGLGESGYSAAVLLRRLGAHVVVNDQKPRDAVPLEKVADLERRGISVVLGSHPDDIVHAGVDWVVKNPGIPYTAPPVKQALALGIPVITEIELAYWVSEAPIIGITGSNGKTTTTTLVGHILRVEGRDVIVAGNIGRALCAAAVETRPNQLLVAELSSFQLLGTRTFRPWIGAVLNVYPAHLDYHGTFADYQRAKGRLFANQTHADHAVVNADCPASAELADGVRATVWAFSRRVPVDRGVFLRGDAAVFRGDGPEEVLFRIGDIALPGAHNVENVLAAALIARLAGASPAAIREAVRAFRGVEHRLEFVRELGGVRFYNDSKATNPEATKRALDAFEAPIVWIAGGLDRGLSFDSLIPSLKARVKAVVAYGQTAEQILETARRAGVDHRIRVETVEEAVPTAYAFAAPGDVVLLSPACASWDQFASYEERGRMFKAAVHRLIRG